MIGQKKLRSTLLKYKDFPKCCILVGDAGSGRKTFIDEVLKGQFENVIYCDKSVDSVRATIDFSMKNSGKTLYVFADADNMSVNAKNALLKELEEPPKDAYFLITLTNSNNTLDTILSRGVVHYMDAYSNDELATYMFENHGKINNLLVQICAVPGEIDALYDIIDDFYAYVTKVVDNIALVQGSNAFKISDKINLSSDEDKYDLSLFWRAFIAECYKRIIANYMQNDRLMYCTGVKITSKYIRDLRKSGINKQFLFDNWLLDIREAWFEYADN